MKIIYHSYYYVNALRRDPYSKLNDTINYEQNSEMDEFELIYILISPYLLITKILKPHKQKVNWLIKPATNKIMHPLNPKARQNGH